MTSTPNSSNPFTYSDWRTVAVSSLLSKLWIAYRMTVAIFCWSIQTNKQTNCTNSRWAANTPSVSSRNALPVRTVILHYHSTCASSITSNSTSHFSKVKLIFSSLPHICCHFQSVSSLKSVCFQTVSLQFHPHPSSQLYHINTKVTWNSAPSTFCNFLHLFVSLTFCPHIVLCMPSTKSINNRDVRNS